MSVKPLCFLGPAVLSNCFLARPASPKHDSRHGSFAAFGLILLQPSASGVTARGSFAAFGLILLQPSASGVTARGSFAAFGLLFLLALFFALALSQESEAEEWVVDETGNGDFTELWQAIDNASEGDSIHIKEGNYSIQYITFQENLSFTGEGTEKSRLILDKTWWFLLLYQENLSFAGLNFTADYHDPGSQTTAVSLSSAAHNLSIQNCSFFNISSGIIFPYEKIRTMVFNNNSLWYSPLDMRYTPAAILRNFSFHGNHIGGRPIVILTDQQDQGFSQEAGALVLANCSNIMITDLEMGPGSQGIQMINCENISIENCHINSLGHAVTSCLSRGLVLKDCVIKGKEQLYSGSSVHLWDDRETIISGCSFQGEGVHLQEGRDHILRNNHFLGEMGASNEAYYGLQLTQTRNVTVEGNSFNKGGISLTGNSSRQFRDRWMYTGGWKEDYFNAFSHEVNNNTLDGRPLVYLVNQSHQQVPEDAGQVVLVHCHNMTVQGLRDGVASLSVCLYNSSHIVVRGIRVEEAGGDIHLLNSHDNLIENCTTAWENGVPFSMVLDLSHGNTVRNCSFGNSYRGLQLDNSRDNQITGNLLVNSSVGLTDQWGTSVGNLITGNTITENRIGIDLSSSGWNNTIRNNNIYNNTKYGIRLINLAKNTLDASGNWWGDETGPYHATDNPNGKGDNVTGNVDFGPWLEEPYTGDEEKSEERKIGAGFWLLFALILLVFFWATQQLPASLKDKTHSAQKIEQAKPDIVSTAPLTLGPSRVNLCPHCGEKFEIGNLNRPLKLNCPFCKEEVMLE